MEKLSFCEFEMYAKSGSDRYRNVRFRKWEESLKI